MAKDEAMAAPAAPATEARARPAGAVVRRRTAARGRRKSRRTGRMVLIGGLALGASLAAAATIYGPSFIGLPPIFGTAPPPPASAPPAGAAPGPAAQTAAAQGPQALTGPAQAIDGATLTVAGQTVRLQGVQSPPASLVCRSPNMEYPCGDVARRVLNDFAAGAPVACTPARTAAADAGVVAAVCRNHRGWDLAALQVEAGWAIIRGSAGGSPYGAAQARAQANGAGLWPGFAKPEQWTQTAAR